MQFSQRFRVLLELMNAKQLSPQWLLVVRPTVGTADVTR
jgi:hypothetical protein